MDPMKEALARRKGKGADVTIMLGGEPEKDPSEDGKTDLAPKTEGEGQTETETDPEAGGQEDADAKLMALMQELKGEPELIDQFQQMLEQMKDADGSQDKAMEEEMMNSMTPNDQEDLKSRAPRSLGDRAKQAALARQKA